MALPFPSDYKSINSFNRVNDGTFHFYDDLPISINSKFSDSVFNFLEKGNIRQTHLSKTYYILNFDEFTSTDDLTNAEVKIKYLNQKFVSKLPATMIEDIKRFVTLFVIAPDLFNRKRKRDKPTTIVRITKNLIKFISFINKKNKYLKYLSDIEISDIKGALKDFPYRTNELQSHLSYLCNPFVSKNLRYGELKFNVSDIKNLKLKSKNKSVHYSPISNDLFQFLTEVSFVFVSGFLDALDIQKVDDNYVRFDSNHYYNEVKQFIFPESFAEYIKYRELIRTDNYKTYFNKSHLYEKKYGFGLDEVHDILYLVQSAAQFIIGLTGMRYSEISNLQRGCLVHENGQWLIKSSVIKDMATDAKINNDRWAIFTFVIDAIRTLEEISKCNFNSFLFSNFHTVTMGNSEEKITSSGLNYRWNLYLKKIDKEGTFEGQRIHTHQLRHTMTEQLQIAGVNIQYITLHLKHTYNTLDYSVNKVTGGYGNYQNNIVKGITSLNDASKIEFEGSLENIEKYGNHEVEKYLTEDQVFQGQVLTDKLAEKYFKKLQKSGIPPIHVDLGYCTRDFSDIKSLKTDTPPCVVDFKCKAGCSSRVLAETILPSLNSVNKTNNPSDYHDEENKFNLILDALKSFGIEYDDSI